MKLCSHNHDEVCYKSLYCPVCKEMSDHKDTKDKLYVANREIAKLENDIDALAEE